MTRLSFNHLGVKLLAGQLHPGATLGFYYEAPHQAPAGWKLYLHPAAPVREADTVQEFEHLF